jgi:hypothetical protein
MGYYQINENNGASIVGGLKVEIHNMRSPDPLHFPVRHWIVCKVVEGEFWYYGRYDNIDRARKAKKEINGVIFKEPAIMLE